LAEISCLELDENSPLQILFVHEDEAGSLASLAGEEIQHQDGEFMQEAISPPTPWCKVLGRAPPATLLRTVAGTSNTFESCQQNCDSDTDCKAFSFAFDGRCFLLNQKLEWDTISSLSFVSEDGWFTANKDETVCSDVCPLVPARITKDPTLETGRCGNWADLATTFFSTAASLCDCASACEKNSWCKEFFYDGHQRCARTSGYCDYVEGNSGDSWALYRLERVPTRKPTADPTISPTVDGAFYLQDEVSQFYLENQDEEHVHKRRCTNWGGPNGAGLDLLYTVPSAADCAQQCIGYVHPEDNTKLCLEFFYRASDEWCALATGDCNYDLNEDWSHFVVVPQCNDAQDCSSSGTASGVKGSCTCECNAGFVGDDCSGEKGRTCLNYGSPGVGLFFTMGLSLEECRNKCVHWNSETHGSNEDCGAYWHWNDEGQLKCALTNGNCITDVGEYDRYVMNSNSINIGEFAEDGGRL